MNFTKARSEPPFERAAPYPLESDNANLDKKAHNFNALEEQFELNLGCG